MTSGLLARLEGQVLGAVETLRKVEAMARAEGRPEMALSLAAIDDALGAVLVEVAAARRAGPPRGSRPDGAGPPVVEPSGKGGPPPPKGPSR